MLGNENVGWKARVDSWLDNRGSSETRNPFPRWQCEACSADSADKDTGLRMVINIGAEALLNFLQPDVYKNI
jgi:hypothetical protein